MIQAAHDVLKGIRFHLRRAARWPEEELGEVQDATVVLKNGRSARVTMHLIEGSKEEIENTFRQSIEAFFEMYPEI